MSQINCKNSLACIVFSNDHFVAKVQVPDELLHRGAVCVCLFVYFLCVEVFNCMLQLVTSAYSQKLEFWTVSNEKLRYGFNLL